MAATITEVTGLPVTLVPGARGELSVRVDDRVVARKSLDGFPSPGDCAAAVGRAIGPSGEPSS